MFANMSEMIQQCSILQMQEVVLFDACVSLFSDMQQHQRTLLQCMPGEEQARCVEYEGFSC